MLKKVGKSLKIHYTNVQGLDDKVSFSATSFAKDDAEYLLLLAQTLWKKDLLDRRWLSGFDSAQPNRKNQRGLILRT